MTRMALALVLATLAAPDAAENLRCLATINGSEVTVEYEPGSAAPVTRRERALGWPGKAWNRAWGTPPACDSGVVIAYLGQTLAADEIEGYCLAEEDETGTFLLVPGERNFRGRCRKTACQRVNAAADDALAASGALARTVTDVATGRSDSRLSAVAHSSGAAILSGNAGPLSAALSGIGPGVMAILTAPATLAAAAVSVVTIGGAVYVCHD